VQETFLEAHRAFDHFQGTTEAELLSWLRRILASRLTALVRRFYEAERRNVRLERTIEEHLDRSSSIATSLASPESSAATRAVRREQAVVLADALERLPTHYRRVILLRHFEELSFPDIARRMQRSLDSVKNLWVRALASLNDTLGEQSHGTR
jgi:RNA polymerase sigma-70 factor (ECF subfamily)